jgi:outer membrane protein assembly factor BamD (BamD/ComL family)
MKKSLSNRFIILACFLLSFTVSSFAQAALIYQNGQFRDADLLATMPVYDHFSLGVAAMNRSDWEEAAHQFAIVTSNFPNSSYGAESHYYLALAYYNLEDCDLANQELTAYLKAQTAPKFFEQAIEYKFLIAEKLSNGAGKHLFGYKSLPKWSSGKSLALTIYDEVIAVLPCQQVAAKALFSKGNLLWELKDYRSAIASFQLIVKRFPKSQLTPDSYLAITEIYLEQSELEFQNPDLLALAQINLRRFEQDYPREERLVEARSNVAQIKEIYARGLYDTGQFYERVRKPQASILYYRNAINQFPDTAVAQQCRARLDKLVSNQNNG